MAAIRSDSTPSWHDLMDNSPVKSNTPQPTNMCQLQQEVVLLKRPGETPADIIRSRLLEVGDHLEENMGAILVLDLDELVSQYRHWKELLPRVMPCYAVKCNPSMPVVRVLAALGCGFDCASKREILQVFVDSGVPAERVIYANTVKDPIAIRAARDVGVDLMTFDSLEEVDKVHAVFPEARLVLRIRCDAKDSLVNLGDKFGVEWHEVEPLVRHAHALGVTVAGVSFHVGSDCRDYDAYRRAIDMSRRVFDLAKKYDFTCNLLDIGGGFPGSWRKDVKDIAAVVNSALTEFFPESMFPHLRIVSEPGRYFACRMGTAAVRVIGMRTFIPPPCHEGVEEVGHGEEGYGTQKVYVNDGTFGIFNTAGVDHANLRYSLAFPKPVGEVQKRRVTMYGPTCASVDCLGKNVELESNVEVGDWLLVDDMGAYSNVLRTSFNGFDKARVLHVGSEETLNLLSMQQPSAFWIDA